MPPPVRASRAARAGCSSSDAAGAAPPMPAGPPPARAAALPPAQPPAPPRTAAARLRRHATRSAGTATQPAGARARRHHRRPGADLIRFGPARMASPPGCSRSRYRCVRPAAPRSRQLSVSTDLLQLTADLVAVPSESFAEGAITDLIESELRSLPHLEVTRVGDNLVARTQLGPARARRARRAHRHRARPTATPRRASTATCCGVSGAADMKAGLAVMCELARRHSEPAVDVTYVFYAREEVASVHSGLARAVRPAPGPAGRRRRHPR